MRQSNTKFASEQLADPALRISWAKALRPGMFLGDFGLPGA
jgi:hypothetical protein